MINSTTSLYSLTASYPKTTGPHQTKKANIVKLIENGNMGQLSRRPVFSGTHWYNLSIVHARNKHRNKS
jgi:hypothetical protein